MFVTHETVKIMLYQNICFEQYTLLYMYIHLVIILGDPDESISKEVGCK